MAQRQTQTAQYWVEDFQVTQEDIDYLYGVLLELETPLSIDEMALLLVRYRTQQEETRLSRRPKQETLYRPESSYKVGDEITFPALGYATGKVIDSRPGDNPDYGDFTVIKVEMEGGQVAEFASDLKVEHILNQEEETTASTEEGESLLTPEELFIEYGGHVAEALEARLAEHEDLVRLAGRWFPRSLLLDVNIGHLNLAEAVLDLHGGGPMPTREIMAEAGILEGASERLAEFSLNYALQQDERFDEVGPAGQVLWFLRRMEPEEVLTPPPRLRYDPIPYDPDLLTPELRELEQEIGDEHSPAPAQRGGPPDEITLQLIYPHRRAGTLPLSAQLRRMFPTAYEAPRIRFTIVDAESGEELPSWVVRPGGYVYGLGDWFEKRDLPAGTYLILRRMDEPGKVQIDYLKHKPRKEWLRTAFVENGRLRIDNRQRPVGAEYDELMVIDVEDPEAIDALWEKVTKQNIPLERLMKDIARDLAALNPQGNFHAKTLYSVVNVVRRCPPGPIFAQLVALPEFEHVGGPYWQLRDSGG
ncbi:MAG TPA: hypothetical protein ENI95_09995 [Chloroflexi bacterium]|nr:hypothetical protein [Chloroflexota bacterium]